VEARQQGGRAREARGRGPEDRDRYGRADQAVRRTAERRAGHLGRPAPRGDRSPRHVRAAQGWATDLPRRHRGHGRDRDPGGRRGVCDQARGRRDLAREEAAARDRRWGRARVRCLDPRREDQARRAVAGRQRARDRHPATHRHRQAHRLSPGDRGGRSPDRAPGGARCRAGHEAERARGRRADQRHVRRRHDPRRAARRPRAQDRGGLARRGQDQPAATPAQLGDAPTDQREGRARAGGHRRHQGHQGDPRRPRLGERSPRERCHDRDRRDVEGSRAHDPRGQRGRGHGRGQRACQARRQADRDRSRARRRQREGAGPGDRRSRTARRAAAARRRQARQAGHGRADDRPGVRGQRARHAARLRRPPDPGLRHPVRRRDARQALRAVDDARARRVPGRHRARLGHDRREPASRRAHLRARRCPARRGRRRRGREWLHHAGRGDHDRARRPRDHAAGRHAVERQGRHDHDRSRARDGGRSRDHHVERCGRSRPPRREAGGRHPRRLDRRAGAAGRGDGSGVPRDRQRQGRDQAPRAALGWRRHAGRGGRG
jgi:hypothetical protein